MKKNYWIYRTTIALMVLQFTVPLLAQEKYTESIPHEIVKEIKSRVEYEILNFKMVLNPSISKDSYRLNSQLIRDPKEVLLNDTTGKYTNYELILEVNRLSPYKGNMWDNFYAIRKTGHRFVNTQPYLEKLNGKYIEIPAYADTVKLDLGAEYFPFDEHFVIYYNPSDEGSWALVSGNFRRYHMYKSYFPTVDLLKWARLRTYQYGADDVHPLPTGVYEGSHGFEINSSNYVLFFGKSTLIPTKKLLIKVPKKAPYEPIQLSYFTADTLYTGRDKYNHDGAIAMVTYSISSEPKNYKELQPKVRVLSNEERLELLSDKAFRNDFLEFKFYEIYRKEEVELNSPIDSIYFRSEDASIVIVDIEGKETDLADELNVRYILLVSGRETAIITEDREIIYKQKH